MPEFLRDSSLYGIERLAPTGRSTNMAGTTWYVWEVVESTGINGRKRPHPDFYGTLSPARAEAGEYKTFGWKLAPERDRDTPGKVIDLMLALKESLDARGVGTHGTARGHGSPELDADAQKLIDLGADPGLSIEDLL